MLIGCIADDFTGATDVANMLVRQGISTVIHLGVPDTETSTGTEAVVVALKSRTAPVDTAVDESVGALRWLRSQGCRQIYFKYCSTFDSTPQGNIGPVTDALMDELGVDYTVACPALPANGRTVYNGYLFVGGELLNESSMRNHPLTPMADASVLRLLRQQTSSPVGLIPYEVVAQGEQAVRSAIDVHRQTGVRIGVVDAIDEGDLVVIGRACTDLPLVTASSGLAVGLAAALDPDEVAGHQLPRVSGRTAVISGSASRITAGQIRQMRACHPAFEITPDAVSTGVNAIVESAVAWADPLLAMGPVLIHTAPMETADTTVSGDLERALAAIAEKLVAGGVRRLVVAGGETSGAVVQALGVRVLRVGPEISPGVPWTFTLDRAQPVALALKSGNFGSADLFTRAFEVLR
ncbi:3-oxo-tetronate kinase [Mycolicibacterium goodii]|uniref:3-oxo-tetronate kinase n=1 Tax=Mycolicibacterium goodii TaxID=134601 RepID=A0A0K0X1D4_MYCGD|nr:membrane protein [Mycolicibacterium goodii]